MKGTVAMTLTDARGHTYANAEEWMKEVGKSPRAEINAIVARDHATGCWRFKLAGTQRSSHRDLAKRASSPETKIGGAGRSSD